MRTFAIGDIHGHFDQWIRLYDKIKKEAKFNPKKDQLIFLGDIIDGGDQTKQMLDWLMKMTKKYPHWKVLFGNHEDLMIDALCRNGKVYGSFDLWYQQGGRQTFQSFLPEGISAYEKAVSQIKDHITDKYIDFINSWPLFYENDKYFFVHAGLKPGLKIAEHKELLKNITVEKLDKAESLLQHMIWTRDEFIESDYDWGKKIVFGHTATHSPIVRNNKIGIDMMFHNDGSLCALELPVEKFYFEESFLL